MGEGGRVKGDCLECPFHSWTFRGEDGRCDNIPYAEKGNYHLTFTYLSQFRMLIFTSSYSRDMLIKTEYLCTSEIFVHF